MPHECRHTWDGIRSHRRRVRFGFTLKPQPNQAPSNYTQEILRREGTTLPFADKPDVEERCRATASGGEVARLLATPRALEPGGPAHLSQLPRAALLVRKAALELDPVVQKAHLGPLLQEPESPPRVSTMVTS